MRPPRCRCASRCWEISRTKRWWKRWSIRCLTAVTSGRSASFPQTVALLLGVYAVAIAAMTAFLSMLLRPLREIERVAVAIGGRDFRTIGVVPRALIAVCESHADAARRLFALLDARPALARRLIFEMTEFGALREWTSAQRFSGELRRRGARVALDNFGMLQESLMVVHALRPAYIKLSPGYTRELRSNADCRFLVASLVRIARSLDIGIYAQAVEDESLVPVLAELQISGYQGYAISRPARIA